MERQLPRVAGCLLLALAVWPAASAHADTKIKVTYTADADGCVIAMEAKDKKIKKLEERIYWDIQDDSDVGGSWEIVKKAAVPFYLCGQAATIPFTDGQANCRTDGDPLPKYDYGILWKKELGSNCADFPYDPEVIFRDGKDFTFWLSALTAILALTSLGLFVKLRALKP